MLSVISARSRLLVWVQIIIRLFVISVFVVGSLLSVPIWSQAYGFQHDDDLETQFTDNTSDKLELEHLARLYELTIPERNLMFTPLLVLYFVSILLLAPLQCCSQPYA